MKMMNAPADKQRIAEGVYEIAPVKPELSTEPNAVYRREARKRRADMSPDEVEADKLRIRHARRDAQRAEYRAHKAAGRGETPQVEPQPPVDFEL
jgi:hypothetical protein